MFTIGSIYSYDINRICTGVVIQVKVSYW